MNTIKVFIICPFSYNFLIYFKCTLFLDFIQAIKKFHTYRQPFSLRATLSVLFSEMCASWHTREKQHVVSHFFFFSTKAWKQLRHWSNVAIICRQTKKAQLDIPAVFHSGGYKSSPIHVPACRATDSTKRTFPWKWLISCRSLGKTTPRRRWVSLEHCLPFSTLCSKSSLATRKWGVQQWQAPFVSTKQSLWKTQFSYGDAERKTYFRACFKTHVCLLKLK